MTMCSESIKQRIADLRDRAEILRKCAVRAERYQDGFINIIASKRLNADANVLEQSLKQDGQS